MYGLQTPALFGLGALAAWAWRLMNQHSREVAEYRKAHPDATGPEIERALLERSIDANLEKRFERYRGMEYTGGWLNMPIYWYRDDKGRARWTNSPHNPTSVREWLAKPPKTFRDTSTTH